MSEPSPLSRELLARWPTIAANAGSFIDQLRDEFEVRCSPQATQPTAVNSAAAVLLLGFLGRLSALPQATRTAWARHLAGYIGDDGLIVDAVDTAEPTQPQPPWALRAHRTRHVLWAIETLEPRFTPRSIPWARPLLATPQAMDEWLDQQWPQFREAGFWAVGNWLMDVGVLLDTEYRYGKNRDALKAQGRMLDYLARRIDPATGFWFGCDDDERAAMAGAMHLYPLYWSHGREVPCFRQAVLHTLNLQQPDGLFAYDSGFGGEQCLDFDAVFVLINGHAAFADLRPAIRQSCQRVLEAIVTNELPSGGWSDSRKDQMRYWATRACPYRSDGGSIWDTYARLMTVAMALYVVTGQAPADVQIGRHLFEIWFAGRGQHRLATELSTSAPASETS